jgi:ribosomal protein L3 glutamine methyltransferase
MLAIPQDRAEWVLDGVLLLEERRRLAAAVQSRLQGRPTAYITGRAPYCGLEFLVDERVLIPRSPLGMMLTEGLQPWLGAEEPLRIVDLCTGSGCLGIVAALAFPEAEVVLTDIDPGALSVARRNVARFHLEHRIELRAGDGLAALQGEEPFDLVLANPPYVDQAAMDALPKEFRFEPRHALAAGEDGLAFVTPFLRGLSAYLAPEGLLALEVGYSAPALEARYPEVPWLWPDLPQGGAGLALLSGNALRVAEAAGALA